MEALKWRPQEDYKRGTRTCDDFFIGVERIHEYVLGRCITRNEHLEKLCALNRITMSGNYELQVDMWDWDDVYAVARYGSFEVTSESDGFRLLGRGTIFL